MKICKTCGHGNADSATQCTACSCALSDSSVSSAPVVETTGMDWDNNTKPKRSGKPLAIFAGAVAVIGAIVAGTLFFGGSSARAVENALDKNTDVLMEKIDYLENLNGFLDNADALNDEGDFVLSASIETNELDLSGSVDYSRSERILSGTLSYVNSEQDLDLQFDFSANKKVFMLASDRLTSDIYGFKLNELEKKFNSTPIVKLLPIFGGVEELDLDFFKKSSSNQTIAKKYCDAWKTFKKSVRYEEINERLMEIGSEQVMCSAYEITWDTEAASDLISTVLGTETSTLSALNKIIAQLEPDCRVYIDENGYLVAADCIIAGNKCILTFEGEEGLWEKCYLQSESLTSGEGDIWGKLEITSDEIQGTLDWDGVMDLSVEYVDTTGAFRFEADLLGLPWEIDGKISSEDGSAQLIVGGYIPDYGNISLSWEQAPLANEPEMLSDKYVDLLGKDLRNWERLLIDINNAG